MQTKHMTKQWKSEAYIAQITTWRKGVLFECSDDAAVYLVAKSADRDPSDGDGSVSDFCVELRSISQLWS